jgi:transcriptional regulator with XRE-family HTH domain
MIAEALRLLRTYHKTSQSQLATDLGISKSYLSEIESGKKKVTLDLLNQYSSHFHVPLSALFFFAEELDRSRAVDRAHGAIALGALRLLSRIASGIPEGEAEC